MKITCHACDAKYTIADEKVTGRTVKIKCKKCGATIVVNADPSAAGAPMSTGAPAYAEPQPQASGEDDGMMATRVFGGDTGAPSVSTPDWTVSLTGEDERQMSQLQIAEEMQRGTITADTYVWRDGMTDWLPVSQVAELAGLLARAAPAAAPAYAAPAHAPVDDEPGMGLAGTMIMTDNSAASPFAAPRPAAGASPYAPPPALAAAPVPAASPALAPVTQPTAARRANRTGGAVDVFAAAAETRDAGGPPRPPTPAARLGERNENSVLFSLSALTATENAASKSSSSNNDDAVIDMGFGRGGNGSRSAVDDLMNMGGGAIGGPMLAPPPLLAPVVEPPPAPVPIAPVVSAQPMSMSPGSMSGYGQQPPAKSKTGLIIGIAAAVVVLGGVGIFFAVSGGPKATADTTSPTTSATASAAPVASSAVAANTAAPAVTDAPVASAAPAASSAVVAANDTNSKTPSSGTGGGPAPSGKASSASGTPTATASAAPTPSATASTAPTADPAGGNRDFNKGAATTALAGAAGAAKGCKTADGPTGSASVRVVFAPSGNVTSANVQGPPFAGTSVGGCIAAAFRGAHVPPFDGSPVAVSKTVNIN